MIAPLRLAAVGRGHSPAALAAVLLRTGLPIHVVEPAGAEVLLCSGPPVSGSRPSIAIPVGSDWRRETECAFRALHGADSFDGPTLPFDLCLAADATLAGRSEAEAERDLHDRPDPAASPAAKAGLLATPFLDRLCRMLGRELWRAAGRRAAIPAAEWFCCLTLDIDSDGLFRGRAALRAIRESLRENPRRTGSLVRAAIRTNLFLQKDPHLTVRYLAEALDGMAMPATFFVQTHRAHRLDNYALGRSGELLHQLRDVMENGVHEVGLHSSYSTRERGPRFWAAQWRRLRQQLGRTVTPVHRGHYLRTEPEGRFAPPEMVDSTLGYGSQEGFRRGTAWPFMAGGAIEQPPCVMDTTLRFHRALGPEAAFERMMAMMEAVRTTGGAFVPVFHPNNMDPWFWPDWSDVFFDLASAARRSGGVMQSLARTARSLYERHRKLEGDLIRSAS